MKKNNIKLASLLVLAVSILAIMLTACGTSTNGIEVKFMVDGSVYKTESFASVDSISLPTNPSKDGYEFIGWYTTDTFDAGTKFDSSSVDTKASSIVLYARFAETTIQTYVDGEAYEVTSVLELSELLPKKEGLSFDGWYIDSGFTTKYTSQDVDNIYGRFMAKVTISNGYEEVYSEFVQVGEKFTEPNYADFKEYYMSSENYYYTHGEIGTQESTVKFDFSEPITMNTSINLVWASEGLNFSLDDQGYAKITGITSFSMGTLGYPVVSVPSYVDIDGKTTEVRSITSLYYDVAETVIINYNVKGITNVCSSNFTETPSVLSNLILPDSLELVMTSFITDPNLTNLILPDGVEVIINAFRASKYDMENIAYTIAIPDSVIYLSQVTTNLSFSNKSVFYKENENIYTDVVGKKTLVATNTIDGDIEVEEGVYGITASAFRLNGNVLKNLYLPSTFEFVQLFPLQQDYEYMSAYLMSGVTSYSILQNLDGSQYGYKAIDSIIINKTSLDASLENSILDVTTAGAVRNYLHADFDGTYKVVFNATIEAGNDATIKIFTSNSHTNEDVSVSASIVSGTTVSQNDIIDLVTINGITLSSMIESGVYAIDKISQFGKSLFEDSDTFIVDCNLYLTIIYGYSNNGITYELASDGLSYIVSGFAGIDNATQLTDGSYIIIVPAEYEGLPITEIKEEAFMNNSYIGIAIISNTVTIVGKKAFYNTSNLQAVTFEGKEGIAESNGGVDVYGTIGAVEYIYESAFELSGVTKITLGLESVKFIAPYAFKNENLYQFVNIDQTTEFKGKFSYVSGWNGAERDDLVIGNYYFSYEKTNMKIIRYMGRELQDVPFGEGVSTTTETMYYNQLVAIAGGGEGVSTSTGDIYFGYLKSRGGALGLGYSECMEILEGSVYYFNVRKSDGSYKSTSGMIFINISKVHKNAFTDIDEQFIYRNGTYSQPKMRVWYYATSTVIEDYLQTEFYAQADSTSGYYTEYVDENGAFNGVFEDGWWEGIMSTDENHDSDKFFFADALAGNDFLWVN